MLLVALADDAKAASVSLFLGLFARLSQLAAPEQAERVTANGHSLPRAPLSQLVDLCEMQMQMRCSRNVFYFYTHKLPTPACCIRHDAATAR